MSTLTEWEIKATEFGNCSCHYGCPCQFNVRPDKGYCKAIVGFQIHEGHFGEVPLAGLRMAAIWDFPGAVHEGNGTVQLIIDERADASQRDALVQILNGQSTHEMATVWAIFSAMAPNKHPPLFRPIEFEADVDGRRGRLEVAGLITMRGEPIRNPITGNEHRIRIDLPEGFEFRLAEIGNASSTASGLITFELRDSYAQFAHIHLGHTGRLN